MSLRCSGLYLSQFRLTSPQVLASGDGTKSAIVIGDVYIHPSAKVHPTAKVPLVLPLVEATFSYSTFITKHSVSSINRLVPTSQSLQMLVLDRVSGLSAVSSSMMLRSWYVFVYKRLKEKRTKFSRD